MEKAFVALAVLVGAVACSSSGASGISQQLCALASACATSTTSESFGQLCEFLQAEASLGPTAGSEGAVFASELSCLESASDCTSLRACFTVPAAVAAACNGVAMGTNSVCSMGYAVQCGSPKVGGLTPGSNCSGAGLVCAQDKDGASCGTATCDPTTTKPKCDGDNLVTCEEPGGALSSATCKGALSTACSGGTGGGFTCETRVSDTCAVVAGVAQCVGSGAACDMTTFKASCKGTTIVGCSGGKTGTLDCTTEDPNATCQLDDQGAPTCVGAGTQCTDKTPETCANGVITYCSWGTTTTVNCKSFGLSGCTTFSNNQQTGAACTQ